MNSSHVVSALSSSRFSFHQLLAGTASILIPARTICVEAKRVEEVTAACTSKESWQRFSHELMFDASRTPERMGISSFVDMWARFVGWVIAGGGVGRRSGISRCCWKGERDVEVSRWGGNSWMINGFVAVEWRRHVGWRGDRIGNNWERVVVRVKQGINDGLSEARVVYMHVYMHQKTAREDLNSRQEYRRWSREK